MNLEILYHQGPYIAVDKPAGILTQAPRGIPSLEEMVKDYLRAKENKTGNIYLGVPHRLDRPVSGVILFARHVRAARAIAEQFQNACVRKIYYAVVRGVVSKNQLVLRDYMYKIPGEAKASICEKNHPLAKEAILECELVKNLVGISILKLSPKTGRMHQIRLQLQNIGHAILGDTLYGEETIFGENYEDPRKRAIALHARSLEFFDKKQNKKIEVCAPWPKGFLEYII